MYIVHKNKQLRSGAVLICVLTCLLVAMSLVATAIQMSVRSRRECRVSQHLRQADLLADAGQSRAIWHLQHDSNYQGDFWRPTLESSHFDSAEVEIVVDRQDAIADVTVTAKLQSSLSAIGSAQRTRKFTVQLSQLTKAE